MTHWKLFAVIFIFWAGGTFYGYAWASHWHGWVFNISTLPVVAVIYITGRKAHEWLDQKETK